MSTPAKLYEYNGQTHTLREWADIFKISYDSLRSGVYKHGSVGAWVKVKKVARLYDYQGEMLTMNQIAARAGVNPNVLRHRVERLHIPLETAIALKTSLPKKKKGTKQTAAPRARKCRRYDCLHQDGSGVCVYVTLENNCDNCPHYKDAYEYYYGDEYLADGLKKLRRSNTTLGAGGAMRDAAEQGQGKEQQCDGKVCKIQTESGSAYVYKSTLTEAKHKASLKNEFAEERKALLEDHPWG